jgi:tellurite methyltransferase
MQRAIEGFHQDALGDWVADLTCGHGQHVRHKPPFWIRAWTLTAEGRASRIGIELDCVRCDRFEMPEGFVSYKRTGEFDERTVPAGLLANHSTKHGVWGVLRVLAGGLSYIVEPPLAREVFVDAEHPAVIVPEVAHRVRPEGAVRFFVEFFRKPG